MNATLTDAVDRYFRSRPFIWIDQSEIAKVGGVGGWRTRISQCTRRGLTLEKRQRVVTTPDGRRLRLSERRFIPREAR